MKTFVSKEKFVCRHAGNYFTLEKSKKLKKKGTQKVS